MGMKLTILGESGSGKTCYLLGMHRRMSAGIKEHSLTTLRDADATQLAQMYANLRDTSIGKERFPVSSPKLETYHFGLNIATYRAMDFDWVDYPGEYVDPAKGHAGSEEYKMVKRSIRESSALLICLDGENLIDGDTDEKIYTVKDNSAVYIMPFITELAGEFQKQNKILPPIGIIVTKWDLCMDTTTETQLREIVEEVFSPLFKSTDTVLAVIPVSLGRRISDDGYKGKVKPINIQLPILYGIRYALRDSIAEDEDKKKLNRAASERYISGKRDEIKEQESDIRRWRNEIQEERDSWWPSDSYINTRNEWINDAQAEINSLNAQINSERNECERTIGIIDGGILKKQIAISNLLGAMTGINLAFYRGKWQAGVE